MPLSAGGGETVASASERGRFSGRPPPPPTPPSSTTATGAAPGVLSVAAAAAAGPPPTPLVPPLPPATAARSTAELTAAAGACVLPCCSLPAFPFLEPRASSFVAQPLPPPAPATSGVKCRAAGLDLLAFGAGVSFFAPVAGAAAAGAAAGLAAVAAMAAAATAAAPRTGVLGVATAVAGTGDNGTAGLPLARTAPRDARGGERATAARGGGGDDDDEASTAVVALVLEITTPTGSCLVLGEVGGAAGDPGGALPPRGGPRRRPAEVAVLPPEPLVAVGVSVGEAAAAAGAAGAAAAEGVAAAALVSPAAEALPFFLLFFGGGEPFFLIGILVNVSAPLAPPAAAGAGAAAAVEAPFLLFGEAAVGVLPPLTAAAVDAPFLGPRFVVLEALVPADDWSMSAAEPSAGLAGELLLRLRLAGPPPSAAAAAACFFPLDFFLRAAGDPAFPNVGEGLMSTTSITCGCAAGREERLLFAGAGAGAVPRDPAAADCCCGLPRRAGTSLSIGTSGDRDRRGARSDWSRTTQASSVRFAGGGALLGPLRPLLLPLLSC